MAIATKRTPKTAQKGKVRKPAARKTARQQPAAAEREGPDRSAPPLAEIDADALEFIEAIDQFKKQHGRPFPSWSEVLMVLRQLGYSRR